MRFGPYEVNRQSGEIRKYGSKIKLAPQPLEILLLLLERAPELVTREELRQRLWAQDVFVDFERSLNTAVKKLRGSLGDSSQESRYIETLPRQGYRFIGKIVEVASAGEANNTKVQDVSGDDILPVGDEFKEKSSPDMALVARKKLGWWVAASLALLAAAGGLFLFARHRKPDFGAGTPVATIGPHIRSSIAILGFTNLSFQHQGQWLGTAITQMLATELQAGGKLRIIPDEAVNRAKTQLDLKEKDGYPRETLRQLQKNLSSDYVVAGSYIALGDRESGQVRLDMRLQESISGENLASISVSGKQSELFDLVKAAGREMQTRVAGTIGPEGDADWRMVFPADREAARLYSDGLSQMRTGDNLSARKLLEQSVAIEPQFALSHAALAQAWQGLGYDDRAQVSAQKALSLAVSLPENVRLRVEGQYYESQHDWDGAIPAYQHLFKDYPDDLEAGLKLAQAEISAGQLSEATATISGVRSLETADRQDPRIDLLEALIASHNSDFKTQQELARKAAKKAEKAGSRLLLARAKLTEGWALDDQTQVDGALQAYREAQSIFVASGDDDATATVLDDIGIVLEKQGKLQEARDNLEQAQKLFRHIGDENGLGASLTNLGELDHAEGYLGEAEDLYREALVLFRKNGRKDNEYATLNNLGGVLFRRGEFREAKNTYQQVLRLRRAAGDKAGEGYAKINLAAALWVEGDLDGAVSLLEEALRIFREVGDRAAIGSVETAYARVLISKHDDAAARHHLLEAIKILQETGAKGEVAAARMLLAKVALSEGHVEQVDQTSLQSSFQDLQAEHREADEMEALTIESQAYLANGNLKQAQQSLTRAKTLHGATWLSNYELLLASARVDAAEGHSANAHRTMAVARTKAKQAGCGACATEAIYSELR